MMAGLVDLVCSDLVYSSDVRRLEMYVDSLGGNVAASRLRVAIQFHQKLTLKLVLKLSTKCHHPAGT